MSASKEFRDAMDELVEIEFNERYYGLEAHPFREYPTLEELGVGGEDDWAIEYRGYWDDADDYELPWKLYTPPVDWSEIPF